MAKSNLAWALGVAGAAALSGYLLIDQEDQAAQSSPAVQTPAQQAMAQREKARDLIVGANPFQALNPAEASASAGPSNSAQATSLLAAGNQSEEDADPGAAPEGDAQAHASLEEEVKRQRLKELGYFIDESYYKMPLLALQEAAQKGNAQALTHLAERYLFELDGRPKVPGHQPDFNYREAARGLLQDAFVAGNAHAAAMVSESLLTERNLVDAAAWNMVAKRAGDKLSADWFTTTADYRALDEVQKQAVAQRSEQIWQSLQARRQGKGRSG